jgi:hypothetical protein
MGNVRDRSETGDGNKLCLGGRDRQGWYRKEMAVLRTGGVLIGCYVGTEMNSSAEGGVKEINDKGIERKCGME